MRERDYRESRVCRIIGNPTAYRILRALMDGSRRQPSELARLLGLGLTTVSATLRILRTADLVRYVREGKSARYWIKYPVELRSTTASLRRLVLRTSRRLRKDR